MVSKMRYEFCNDIDMLIGSILTEATIQLLFDLEQRWKSDVNIVRQILSIYLILSSSGRFSNGQSCMIE